MTVLLIQKPENSIGFSIHSTSLANSTLVLRNWGTPPLLLVLMSGNDFLNLGIFGIGIANLRTLLPEFSF